MIPSINAANVWDKSGKYEQKLTQEAVGIGLKYEGKNWRCDGLVDFFIEKGSEEFDWAYIV